jgi:hypothetical protein
VRYTTRAKRNANEGAKRSSPAVREKEEEQGISWDKEEGVQAVIKTDYIACVTAAEKVKGLDDQLSSMLADER